MLECARQNVLATESLVTAKDYIRLKKRWDEGEVLKISAKFLNHGCFASGSTQMAVFQHLWGSVERLRELIDKIEQEEPKVDVSPAIELQSEGGFISARVTNRSSSEVRVEHLWIAVMDATGKKTLTKDRIRKFKRCDQMPHVM